MNDPHWYQQGMPHIWMPYCQMQTAPDPLPVVRTEGVYLVLDDGRRLIDGLASWWTACHGYNHPRIQAAVAAQLAQMPHVMLGGLVHERALQLAAELAVLAPGELNRVFFSDSGSVAVEVAMKMAVQVWLNRGLQGRTRFLAFENAYHGDTTGAMSVCDPINSMHAHFRGFLLEQHVAPLPRDAESQARFERTLTAHRDEIAAVLIEPLVQGAGGMKFHSAECLARVRKACDANQVLLIADELATGFGRTGSLFACEQADVVPDILCLGKALTGGTLGLAATVATDEVFEAFLSEDPLRAFMHGPTFMANPLACAASLASLELFHEEPRLRQVAEIEATMQDRLEPCRQLPGIVDVRCKGAVGVIQVEQLHSRDRLRSAFVERGVWVRPFADMFYLTPPLTITPDELETLCEALVDVVTAWSAWPSDA